MTYISKIIIAECMNELCANLVETNVGAAARGTYCEGCRREARKLYNKKDYERRKRLAGDKRPQSMRDADNARYRRGKMSA